MIKHTMTVSLFFFSTFISFSDNTISEEHAKRTFPLEWGGSIEFEVPTTWQIETLEIGNEKKVAAIMIQPQKGNNFKIGMKFLPLISTIPQENLRKEIEKSTPFKKAKSNSSGSELELNEFKFDSGYGFYYTYTTQTQDKDGYNTTTIIDICHSDYFLLRTIIKTNGYQKDIIPPFLSILQKSKFTHDNNSLNVVKMRRENEKK